MRKLFVPRACSDNVGPDQPENLRKAMQPSPLLQRGNHNAKLVAVCDCGTPWTFLFPFFCLLFLWFVSVMVCLHS